MRRRLTAGLLLLGLCLPASAAARSAYCSPTGDYCTSAKARGDGAVLRIATFSFRGRVRLCVRPPEGRGTCRRFRLRERRGLFVSTVRWARHFPDRGRGVYRVRWQKFGNNLGPPLTFPR